MKRFLIYVYLILLCCIGMPTLHAQTLSSTISQSCTDTSTKPTTILSVSTESDTNAQIVTLKKQIEELSKEVAELRTHFEIINLPYSMPITQPYTPYTNIIATPVAQSHLTFGGIFILPSNK